DERKIWFSGPTIMETFTFDDASKMTSEALFEQAGILASCHMVVDEKARGDRAVPATAQRSRLTASRCRPRLGN
ncbi:MAG: hypothetical protein WBV90_17395, partial [Terrimicrobiaceae bacterium]